MTADEVKQEIAKRTGIPASLLTGETPEEDFVRAKALLALKRDNQPTTPKSTNQQFAEWFKAQLGEEQEEDSNMQALKAYEEELRIANGGYPYLQDNGEVPDVDMRDAKQDFAEHFYQHPGTGFNPKKKNGWITTQF